MIFKVPERGAAGIRYFPSKKELQADGRGHSDVHQGVTLEVMGEGDSMGPLNDRMKKERLERQGDIRYSIEWTTLGEYLQYLERRGVSPSVASFIGAATPRIYVIGEEDRPPTDEELKRLQQLVRQAMEDGALGVASSLVYPPGFFAKTDELIALARIAAEYNGIYISHLRSEGAQLMESLEELLTIAREAGIRAEVYHLKTAGRENWPKMDQVIARVEKARSEGLQITADVYTYLAGSTGLNSTMPPWVQDGGFEASIRRMKDSSRCLRMEATPERSRGVLCTDRGGIGTRPPAANALSAFLSDIAGTKWDVKPGDLGFCRRRSRLDRRAGKPRLNGYHAASHSVKSSGDHRTHGCRGGARAPN